MIALAGITRAVSAMYEAEESELRGCPRRLPNIGSSLSNHLYGNAIDASIPWVKGRGELDDPIANEIVSRFGLRRPVPKERWHFELPKDTAPVMDFSKLKVTFEFDLTTVELANPQVLDFSDYEPVGAWTYDD